MLHRAVVLMRNIPWRVCLQAAVMLLLTQVRMWGASVPAAAWMCAGFGGEGAVARWLGLLAGAWLRGGEVWWTLPALSGVMLAGWRLYAAGHRKFPAEGALLLAGCLAAADAAAHSDMDAHQAPVWLLCGLAACALTLIYGSDMLPQRRLTVGFAQGVQAPGRRTMPRRAPGRTEGGAVFPPKQWGAALIAAGAASGAALAFGSGFGIMAAAFAAVQWPWEGAMALSVGLAAVLCLSGVPASAATGIIVLQAALGYLEKQPRALRILLPAAAAGVWYLAAGRTEALIDLLALAPAAASIGLLADDNRAAGRADAQRRRRNALRDRLDALSDALGKMAQAHSSGPDPPREDMLLLSLRARLCSGCVRYERCWNGRAGEGSRLLCELIKRSVSGTLPEEASPDMMRRCLRAGIIPDRLYGELERFSRSRAGCAERMDGAKRACLTLDAAARLLREMAREQTASEAEIRLLEAELRLGGICFASVADGTDGLWISRRGGWPRDLRHRAAQIASRSLGMRFECSFCDGRTLALRRACVMVARAGWDGLPAEGGRSGDSVHIGPLDDRRQLVVISDGMGVGSGAAGESRRAVESVVRFLRAGLPPDRAALMANQLMLAQGSGESFATLDLCVIDNMNMTATWVKMAACDSYLLREHDCSVIPGGRLPMGIVAEATPQVTTHVLEFGDVIVMGTDGAMEGLDPDAAQRCLIARRRAEVNGLAKCMRIAGQERRVHVDDQTLAVIRVERAEGVRQDTRRRTAVGRDTQDVRAAAGG